MSIRRGSRSTVGHRSSSSFERSDSAPNDTIDAAVAKFTGVVEAVRSRTTGVLITAVRALVYGLAMATAAVVAVILVAIAAVRVLDIVVPGEVWAAHLITSGVFGLLGAWAWSKRRRDPTKEHE